MNIAAHHSMMLRAGSPTPPGPAYWGLCFTAEEPNVVVNMTKRGSPPAVTLETSTDGLNWTSFDADGSTTPVTLANIGDHVFFRAGSGGNTQISAARLAFRIFTLTGLCAASGNILSLLNSENQIVTLSSQYCFFNLFNNCTSLTTAPELPATTLTDNCYRTMFNGCTSLTTAPELPATTIANSCYYSMFRGCTSLTTAPELPATTLAASCYALMFNGCTSLTTANLSAATLDNNCCAQMFGNCTSLRALSVNFAAWLSGATRSWLFNVAASGTFRCPTALGTDATITRGTSNCPAGWTVINID